MMSILLSLLALSFLGVSSSTTSHSSGEMMEGSYMAEDGSTVEITSSANSTDEQISIGLEGFANCLEEKKAKFYGAFWCPHCQTQKALFGKSAKLLPYVECSTPDGNGQLETCKEIGINNYPTWIFAGGDKVEGNQSLAQLAEKSGCVLPNE